MITHIVAVGDVHGQAYWLEEIISESHRAMNERGITGDKWKFLFIGDYIDRGPDSSTVVRRVRGLTTLGHIALKGNHEDMMVLAAAKRRRQDFDHYCENRQNWLANGGHTTVTSYGENAYEDFFNNEAMIKDMAWMSQLPVSYETEKHFFCHAGIHPEVPLAHQSPDTLLWIRDRFLSDDRKFEKYIVHGHTPQLTGRVDIRYNRCNLDTGAGYDKALSACIFDLTNELPIAIIIAR